MQHVETPKGKSEEHKCKSYANYLQKTWTKARKMLVIFYSYVSV